MVSRNPLCQEMQANQSLKSPNSKTSVRNCEGSSYIYMTAGSDARQSNIFLNTTKEIAKYVGRAFKKRGDARLAIENISLPLLP